VKTDWESARRRPIRWSLGTGLATGLAVAAELGYATRSAYMTTVLAVGCGAIAGLMVAERAGSSERGRGRWRDARDLAYVTVGAALGAIGVAAGHPTLLLLAVAPLAAGAGSLGLAWCLARSG
jgi:hypothetical protein